MPAPDGAGMKTVLTTLIATVLLSLSPVAPPSEAAAVDILGEATELEAAVVEWALGRYEAAGLDLPAMTVEFAGDDDCDGNTAVAIHGGELPQLRICAGDAAEVVLQRTLLHEMAHIWAAHTLDETTKASFLSVRGLDAWSGPGVAWQDSGSEQAAEVVTWALMDRELVMLLLPDHDPAGLLAGYRVLTGAAPPRMSP